MALKQIKNKIKSTERTSKVTKAMEAVSAVKMRKSQERAFEGRPYASVAMRILERLTHSRNVVAHPLLQKNEQGKICLIVITSDKGLAGSVNSAVLKEATEAIQGVSKDEVSVICFGKKAYEFFTRKGYTIDEFVLTVKDSVRLEDVEETATRVLERYTNQTYKQVKIIYQSFISTFEQKAVLRQMLPFEVRSLRAMVKGIIPKSGKWSNEEVDIKNVEYTIEPNAPTVFEALFPLLLTIMIYHALLESKASEHSARMVSMKNATDKAKEMIRTLTLSYNKERQGVITAEVSEITGGIEAMNNA